MVVNGQTANRIRNLAVTVLAAATLMGAGATRPARNFFCSATEFVQYYRALEESTVSAGFLERIAISLALTKVDATGQQQGGRCTI